MTIHVGWLAPKGCWDQNMLNLLLHDQLYPTGLEFAHCEGFPSVHSGCILVVPGKFWRETVERINDAVRQYRWMLAVRVSDEEDEFDIKTVDHPNIKWWVQYARTDRDYADARLIGTGFPPHFNQLPRFAQDKPLDVFLSAQNTHPRRECAFAKLQESDTRLIRATKGFTQGVDPDDYAYYMRFSKIGPAPAGAFSPDTFRLYEALQAHAIPVADDISPVLMYQSRGYWKRLFPDAPFPIVEDYNEVPDIITALLAEWPANANRIVAWWMRYKRSLAHALRDDLTTLGAI